METEHKRDRFDLVIKIVTAIGAVMTGIFLPLVFHISEEKNRESHLYIETMTQREKSDSDLRSKMFDSLIGSYFGKGMETNPEKQMLYLHLLTLNFQEFFDARPLFKDLHKTLTDEKKQERLLAIAREETNRQVNMLTSPDREPAEMVLCVTDTEECHKAGTFNLKIKQGKLLPLDVRLKEVDSSSARVRISVPPQTFPFKTAEFSVSFFDTPFMQNTKLADGTRFSFILKSVDTKSQIAEIEMITFPDAYMSLRDRPYFDEMLSRLGSENGGVQSR